MPRLPAPSLVAAVVVALSSLAHAQTTEGAATDDNAEALPAQPSLDDAFSYETADGRFGIKPLVHAQTLLFLQQDLALDGQTSAGFMVRRARFGLDGHLFTKDLRFQLEGSWDRGQPGLQDAFIRYAFAPEVVFQAGQFKRPFSRDFLTSSSRSLRFERALPNRRFFIGRDIGVMLHNDFERSPGLEYAVGVFNGTGDALYLSRALPAFEADHVPLLFHPAFVARVGVNVGGIDGYSEGDLEGGPLRYAIASSVALDSPTEFNPGLASVEVDFALKAHGAWATGAVFLESGPLDGSEGDANLGLHLEGSYTLGAFVPVLSYALVAPLGGDDWRHEVTAGAVLLVFGRHFRLMGDAVLGVDQSPAEVSTDVGVRMGLVLTL